MHLHGHPWNIRAFIKPSGFLASLIAVPSTADDKTGIIKATKRIRVVPFSSVPLSVFLV